MLYGKPTPYGAVRGSVNAAGAIVATAYTELDSSFSIEAGCIYSYVSLIFLEHQPKTVMPVKKPQARVP